VINDWGTWFQSSKHTVLDSRAVSWVPIVTIKLTNIVLFCNAYLTRDILLACKWLSQVFCPKERKKQRRLEVSQSLSGDVTWIHLTSKVRGQSLGRELSWRRMWWSGKSIIWVSQCDMKPLYISLFGPASSQEYMPKSMVCQIVKPYSENQTFSLNYIVYQKNVRKNPIFTNLKKNIRAHRASSKATRLFLAK